MKSTLRAAGLILALTACTGTPEPADLSAGASRPVIRVLDGDSLLVRADGDELEVRLLGINTPERDECYAAEARQRTTELAGHAVTLVGSERDRFGRLLAYAYGSDGTFINRQLVTEGLALALTGDYSFQRSFKDAEESAFGSRIGRWQPEACGPAEPASIRIQEVEYDAAGDDAQNPNGEWVTVLNDGQSIVSMGGWSVQDESSSHRFAFPAGFTLEPGTAVRIASGCGEPSMSRLYWCDEDPVWNNGGDTAYLLDPAGNVADRLGF